MNQTINRWIKSTYPVIALAFLFLAASFIPLTAVGLQSESNSDLQTTLYPNGYDPGKDPLVKAGYRPRFASPDSPFIQTLEPMPADAVMHPYGWVPNTLTSGPTRATWSEYYSNSFLVVKVDVNPTNRFPQGSLSSQEEQELDRIIDDFINFSWPKVKDVFDPQERVTAITFLVEDIDGPSSTGGYYQPGTDEFHLDRSDFSWGGIIAAHEFQHMVHRQYDINENLWVDEGCADLAAYLVFGITSGIASHVYAYLNWAPKHSVVVDDATFYYDSTTSYYGSSFLFQLYMFEHYGGKNYTYGLVKSTSNGITGVNAGLASSGSSDDFEEAFSKWMVAINVNDDNAGDGETYSYSQKTYPNGQIRLPLTKSHSGTPVDSSLSGEGKIKGFGVNSIRFSSPSDSGETHRLKLSYTAGTPLAALYFESNPPRSVVHIDFGSSRTKTIDLDGWGVTYSSFRLITTSTSGSDLNYELDILDLDPPVTEFSISPKLPDGLGGWYVDTPKITLTSEISAKIYYRLNNEAEQQYLGPFYIPDGIWNISFRAIDRHDNPESYRYFDLKVDTLIPSSSIVVEPDMPEDSWYTSAPLVTLNTAHPNAIIEYKFGNDDYQTYASPFSPPEGASTLFWRSVDQAGNSEEEKSRSFKMDTVLPSIEYQLFPYVPDGKNGFYRTTPTLTLSSDDADALYYSIDGGELTRFFQQILIPDGRHTIRMLPIDKAGNQGEEERIEVDVDTSTPALKGAFEGWDYDRENSSKWITMAPTLQVTGLEEEMTINYTVNGGPLLEYDRQIQINEGTTEIWIYGEDKAGNPADPISFFFKVDMKAPFIEPEISDNTVNGWYINGDLELELMLLNEDERASPVQIEYQWSGGEPKTYRDPISVPDGIATLLYWATDAAGNRMNKRSLEFKKDSTLPSIGLKVAIPEDGIIEVGSPVTFDLSSSEDENGITFYAVDWNGSGVKDWSPDALINFTFNEPGTFTVTGYVRDAAGNTQEKSMVIDVKAIEINDPDGNNDGDNGSSWALFLVIGSIVFLILLICVLAVVLVRYRSHHTPAPLQQFPAQIPPHERMVHIAMASGSNSVPPPPPVPPGQINSDHLDT